MGSYQQPLASFISSEESPAFSSSAAPSSSAASSYGGGSSIGGGDPSHCPSAAESSTCSPIPRPQQPQYLPPEIETSTQYNLPLVSMTYRYEPYSTANGAKIIEEEIFALPEDTLHLDLADQVSFLPYPDKEFTLPPAEKLPDLPREQLVRVFLGQLPYQVTDMQLQWLCSTFGQGCPLFFPERIVKQDKENRARIPTGCIHAYCHPDQVDALIEGLHKRVLIDDTGVWFADTESELGVLHSYVAEMKKDKTLRPHNRPYDTIVAQRATSTFVRKPPHYNQVATAPPAYPGPVAVAQPAQGHPLPPRPPIRRQAPAPSYLC